MKNGLTEARSILFPHLVELYDFEAKIVMHLCKFCGAQESVAYQQNSLELNRVAKSLSFLDRHKHDNWPEIIL